MSKNFTNNAINQQTFGAAGFKYIETTATTGDFVAITVIEEATLGNYEITTGSFTGKGIITTTGDDLANGVVLPAGITIYGDFTVIKLSAGKVLAYNRALG